MIVGPNLIEISARQTPFSSQRNRHVLFRSRTGYLVFGGLFPRPPPEGMPGFLLGALCGTGGLVGALGGALFVAIAISITCRRPASFRAPMRARFSSMPDYGFRLHTKFTKSDLLDPERTSVHFPDAPVSLSGPSSL